MLQSMRTDLGACTVRKECRKGIVSVLLKEGSCFTVLPYPIVSLRFPWGQEDRQRENMSVEKMLEKKKNQNPEQGTYLKYLRPKKIF